MSEPFLSICNSFNSNGGLLLRNGTASDSLIIVYCQNHHCILHCDSTEDQRDPARR